MIITFYHSRNCFTKGQTRFFLKECNFIGFGCGYYEPTFEMTKEQYNALPKSVKKNVIEIKQ